MSEAIWVAIIGLLGIGVTAWGSFAVARRSEKAQRRREHAEEQAAEQSRAQSAEDALWKRLNTSLSDMDKRIKDLEKRLTESEKARRAQDLIIQKLEDRERDREELIQDFLKRHLAVDEWFHAGGYTPPLPDPTWRITQAVEQYLTDQKEASD